MIKRVLIIGGYGNFGKFISAGLVCDDNIQLIISGRNQDKAKTFADELVTRRYPEIAVVDIYDGLKQSLMTIRPDIVVHTSGPYQSQSYGVAQACIDQGCHYIDLSDARDFVVGITELHEAAQGRGVFLCSGASSVPCLSSAIFNEYQSQFKRIETLEYGIVIAQSAERGVATTAAVLSYAGKPFKTLIDGQMRDIYGWQGLKWRHFWRLNRRALGNCDIPDLDLFPKAYPDLKTIRFQAGLGLNLLQMGLWVLSVLVRCKVLPSLEPMASYLLRISRLFDSFGSHDSGFYMTMGGLNNAGQPRKVVFDLIARQGDGSYIPAIPAILIVKKLVAGEIDQSGAYPCMGFVSLREYVAALAKLNIQWQTSS
jgi:hypothetical protein